MRVFIAIAFFIGVSANLLHADGHEDGSCTDDECVEDVELPDKELKKESIRKKPKSNGKIADEFLDSFFDEEGDVIGLDYRTWRIDRKLLFPILVALAFKGLALIPVALTKLTIIGSIAILTAKLSFLLSAIMILRKFLSADKSGGFFTLNPLGFHKDLNRRTVYVG